MKKNNWKWMAVITIAILSLGMSSCSKDGDDEHELPFTKELLVGKWKITSVMGDDAHLITVGAEIEFKADETCKGWYSKETHYTIMKDRLRTYYGATSEPLFVYALIGKSDKTITVRLYGTLSNLSSCTMTWEKVD